MADKKISQLTAAATPLAGTEVLPIVQGGSTVKVSVANLTEGRAVTATNISAGLGAVGTPSYTFTGDPNTGMWSPAADTIAFSEGGAEVMRITNAGNIGIGTSNPVSRLDVNGTGYFNSSVQFFPQDGFRFTSVGAVSAMRFGSAGVGESTGEWAYSRPSAAVILSIGNSGSPLNERMRITSVGNVGIGTSSPSFQLQLSTDSAAKPTTNLWTIASDSRIKTETGEYTKGLDAVCALRPITYQYNGAAGFVATGEENISIIAQEAMQHFPECVGTFEALLNEGDEEKTELFNWNGHALIFALVNAVKELKAMNETLAARVAQIERV